MCPAPVAYWTSDEFRAAQIAGQVSLAVVDGIAGRVGGRVGGESSYAYVEELLGVANEAGVTMGESTCWAKLTALPADHAEDAKQVGEGGGDTCRRG